jgi:hypothetical protein
MMTALPGSGAGSAAANARPWTAGVWKPKLFDRGCAGVALLERLEETSVVALEAVGSNPVIHPNLLKHYR